MSCKLPYITSKLKCFASLLLSLNKILSKIYYAKDIKYFDFEKWRAIRVSVGSVGGVLAWVAWVAYLHGWCASVHDVGGVLAWVAWVAC